MALPRYWCFYLSILAVALVLIRIRPWTCLSRMVMQSWSSLLSTAGHWLFFGRWSVIWLVGFNTSSSHFICFIVMVEELTYFEYINASMSYVGIIHLFWIFICLLPLNWGITWNWTLFVDVPTDSEGIIPSALESLLETWSTKHGNLPRPKILYSVPTACNPTGSCTPLARKNEIYNIARKHELVILEDDPVSYQPPHTSRLTIFCTVLLSAISWKRQEDSELLFARCRWSRFTLRFL